MKEIEVIAVEDEEYYFHRPPGPVHDFDTPNPRARPGSSKAEG